MEGRTSNPQSEVRNPQLVGGGADSRLPRSLLGPGGPSLSVAHGGGCAPPGVSSDGLCGGDGADPDRAHRVRRSQLSAGRGVSGGGAGGTSGAGGAAGRRHRGGRGGCSGGREGAVG